MSYLTVDNSPSGSGVEIIQIQHRVGNLFLTLGSNFAPPVVPVPPVGYTVSYQVSTPQIVPANPNFPTLETALTAAVAKGLTGAPYIGVYTVGQTYLGYYTDANQLPSYFTGGANVVNEGFPQYIYMLFGPRLIDVVINASAQPICAYLKNNGPTPVFDIATAKLIVAPDVLNPLIGFIAFIYLTFPNDNVNNGYFVLNVNNCNLPNIPNTTVISAPLTVIRAARF